MHEWHELTEKLFEDTPGSYDTIIRTYLEEKAKELVKSNRLANWDKNKAREAAFEILGLSPSKESEPEHPNWDTPQVSSDGGKTWNKPKDSSVGELEPTHCFACSASHKVNTPCPKPKDSEVCIEEHSNWARAEYSYCPGCGAGVTRPASKTLATKMLEAIYQHDWMKDLTIGMRENLAKEMARVAEKHHKEKL